MIKNNTDILGLIVGILLIVLVGRKIIIGPSDIIDALGIGLIFLVGLIIVIVSTTGRKL